MFILDLWQPSIFKLLLNIVTKLHNPSSKLNTFSKTKAIKESICIKNQYIYHRRQLNNRICYHDPGNKEHN